MYQFFHLKDSAVLKLKRHNVVTFADQKKVVVLSTYTYKGKRFIYVKEVLQDESDVKNVFKVMEVHPEDDTLETVKDKQLLNVILPELEKLHKKASNKESIKYIVIVGFIIIFAICVALYKFFA